MVNRSLAAGNTIMPPTESVSSGKISVCAAPARCASRSASLPGTAEACGVKESSPPLPAATAVLVWAATRWALRSAMKMTAITATSNTVPCKNSVGRSTAIDPSTARRPVTGIDRATTMSAMNAATNPLRASVTCAPYRSRRGRNASASTPTTAMPKTMSIGHSRKYSMLGLGKIIRVVLRLSGGRPHPKPGVAPWARDRAGRWCSWCARPPG